MGALRKVKERRITCKLERWLRFVGTGKLETGNWDRFRVDNLKLETGIAWRDKLERKEKKEKRRNNSNLLMLSMLNVCLQTPLTLFLQLAIFKSKTL